MRNSKNGSRKEGESPVPTLAGTRTVEHLGEDPSGRLESVRLGDGDGEVGDEEEVIDCHDDEGRAEDPREASS